MISGTQIDFLLQWSGRAGTHVVHLRQTIDEEEDEEREQKIANAVLMFRNVIGMEVIEDALAAGEWLGLEGADGDEDERDSGENGEPWNRRGSA